MIEKNRIYRHIAETWDRAGVEYAFLSGITIDPLYEGRDADIWVSKESRSMAKRLAADVLESHGFDVIEPADPWAGHTWLFGYGTDQIIEIDLVSYSIYGPKILLKRPNSIYRESGVNMDAWGAFSKRVLVKVLSGSRPKDPWIKVAEENAVRIKLSEIYRRDFAAAFLRALKDEDGEWIKANRPKITAGCIRRAFSSEIMDLPLAAYIWLAHELLPSFGTAAPTLALVGPDGCGKSSLLRAYGQASRGVFSGAVHRHLRPSLLCRLGSMVGKSEDKPDADGLLVPSKRPGSMQTIRALYYAFDWLIGRPIQDYRATNLMKLVLYDRCYLDMAVDPYRYRLKSGWGIRTIWRFLPKPDRMIYIDADPGIIHNRKPELTVDEIVHRQRAWKRLLTEGSVHAVVLSDAEPSVLAERLQSMAEKTFIEKHIHTRVPLSLSRQVFDLGSWTGIKFLRCSWREKSTHSGIALKDGRCFVISEKWTDAVRDLAVMTSKSICETALIVAGIILFQRLRPGHPQCGRLRISLEDGIDTVGSEVLREMQKHTGPEVSTRAFYLGTKSPDRKPILFTGRSGGPVVLATKIGGDETTIRLVRREACVLEWLRARADKAWLSPEVVWAGEAGSKYALCQKVLAYRRAGLLRGVENPVEQPLQDLARWTGTSMALIDSEYWNTIRQAIPTIQDPYWRQLVLSGADRIEAEWIDKYMRMGMSHGDYVPWNVGWAGGRAVVIDWEHSADFEPLGLDWIHWLVQVELLVKHRDAAKAFRSVSHKMAHNPKFEAYKQLCKISNIENRELMILYLMKKLTQRGFCGLKAAPYLSPLAQMLAIAIYGE